MSNYVDLTGQRFGRLIVVEEYGRTKNKSVIWLCKCDCGNTHKATTGQLKYGAIKSCGCLRRDMVAEKNFKHGLTDDRLYPIWKSIKDRCYRENNKSYKDYGERGIELCSEWYDFKNFYNWAMNNGYNPNAPKGECTIDRIDPNGNYEPNNCRWVTNTVQQRNKRNNHYITYNGETHPITEWAEILGINKGTLESRINSYGWSIEKALNTPVEKRNRSKTYEVFTYNEKTQTIAQWAKEFNMGFTTLYSRIHNYHWSIEKALETPVKPINKKHNG